MKLDKRIAVITGGGNGIGKAISLAFAEEGADIVIADINGEAARLVVDRIKLSGRRAIHAMTDVSSPEDVARLVDTVNRELGKPDILVNNAGIMGRRAFLFQADDEQWRRIIEINLLGNYYCTKAFLPGLIEKRKGRIINMASIQGKQASPTNSAYTAAKHGILGITRIVAAELGILGLDGITVNAICPGVVDTDLVTGPGGALDQLASMLHMTRESVLEEKIKPLSLQRRLIDPEEIAAMALYLASDDARGITGQAINVCGGSVFY
jgi:NAD(P)-dependent dehydrogenase (short-subunit alcohol dehydrogenase family)